MRREEKGEKESLWQNLYAEEYRSPQISGPRGGKSLLSDSYYIGKHLEGGGGETLIAAVRQRKEKRWKGESSLY